jgi:hypothetical protein
MPYRPKGLKFKTDGSMIGRPVLIYYGHVFELIKTGKIKVYNSYSQFKNRKHDINN